MSTDIVRWSNGKKAFELDALKVWLYLSLPFLFITLTLWAILHYVAQNRERENEMKWERNRETSEA